MVNHDSVMMEPIHQLLKVFSTISNYTDQKGSRERV